MAISSTAFGADSVFYTEGFDSQADMDKWAITTTQSPALAESKLWHIGSSGYEELNASSKNSLGNGCTSLPTPAPHFCMRYYYNTKKYFLQSMFDGKHSPERNKKAA